MRGLDRLAILLVVLTLLWVISPAIEGGFAPRRPPPAPPWAGTPETQTWVPPGRPLAPRGIEPVTTVQDSPPRDSSGTAFAVNAAGYWLTARHVAEHCRQIVLRGESGNIQADTVWIHPNADVALVKAPRGGPPLALSTRPLHPGQDGFHFGFPQGKPAAVHSRLLGATRVKWARRGGGEERGLTWIEVSRDPDFDGPLSGISGGPAVDPTGAVVGVNMAASTRRGRVTTTLPEDFAGLLRQAEIEPGRAPETTVAISPENYGARGAEARRSSAVARVFCLVDKASGRRIGRGT